MTSQLTYQSIRNRIIDLLAWLVECEAAPPDLGMNELVNSWEDWVPGPLPSGYFPEPVFTAREESLIRHTSIAMDAFCAVTPCSIVDERAAIALPQWGDVVAAARVAHRELVERGRMSEDEEESFVGPNNSFKPKPLRGSA